ncbi:M48 family metallopeptidase [Paludisphaera mucosa]|uniref:M48 family metallopeptidase n=1 Tax=Paludisphaera mucosa TaxID=3030827 RepID=A0ABT6F6T6_9BACT|nr:M48 family metallopeptidase [Paludisphaera mucosa]MDG3003300.1 M48 family metallopeptidase [Paludisphaera mucosa]
MIPIPLLIALFLAFGVNTPTFPPDDVRATILQVAGSILAVAAAAFALGLGTAWGVRRKGFATARLRRTFLNGSRLLALAGLGVFGWAIHAWNWPGVVLGAWGWRGSILVDDLLIIAPFLVMQILVWWGTFYGERALQGLPTSHAGRRVVRHLYLKERQSLALILPIVSIFVVRNDVVGRLWPRWQEQPMAETIELAVLGVMVLAASPIFIRLAWPTRSLPDGPLRRRLEVISRRSGFRCADVLVWDTDHTMINACVTGILPRFRYVLLSDALIDTLTPLEIAAVFGHEIGHVAHRHLPYFLYFFVGCLAVLTMASDAFTGLEAWISELTSVDPSSPSTLRDILEGVIVAAAVGAFFWVVFGNLSRRFERQADVYGCKAVSCGSPDCPPHFDLGEMPDEERQPIRNVCPTGVRIFADALATVAYQNGIALDARSWRHGSIASRIAFLQKLAVAPERELAFQRHVRNVRYGLAMGLAASIGFAGAAYWLGVLH